MKQSPRLNVSTLVALLALAPLDVSAQQPQPRGRRSSSSSRAAQRGNSKPSADNKDAAVARRREAVNLLRETAERARTFNDLFYRPHIQLLAADALWKHDEQQARVIFRRAWEAAMVYDKAAQEELERRDGPDRKST